MVVTKWNLIHERGNIKRADFSAHFFYCFNQTEKPLISVVACLLQLAPSVNLTVATLAKAKRLTHFYSVAPLLEKWFACFPSSGDGFFYVNHFGIFCFYAYKNYNSFFLSVSFPRTRREVPSFARRKGQACVHRSEYLNLATFARILHSESISFYYITVIPIFTTVQEWQASS